MDRYLRKGENSVLILQNWQKILKMCCYIVIVIPFKIKITTQYIVQKAKLSEATVL